MSDIPIRIVPLGGLGEFGMNCMVVERGEDAFAIDCGVMFPEEHMVGIDRVIPDLSYLRDLGDRLKGFVLTHGHEDHIGALPYVLSDVNVPIFATKFTAGLLRRKLEEHPELDDVCIEEYAPRDAWNLGGFNIEGLRVTHSIVDACGLAIRSGKDLMVHTGDFKLDPSPIDGLPSDIERFEELGDEGIRLLMSDSTNVTVPGKSGSEIEVPGYLRPVFERTSGRIFVTTFASHIHRIQTIIDLCEEFGRCISLVGRSMENNSSLATRTGHLRIPGHLLLSVREATKLPGRDVCFIVTGSQGEPRSALTRIAMLERPQLEPAPGDSIIFSSRVIPGNEKAIGAVINQLCRTGAEIYDGSDGPVHVSGHACRDELRQMLDLAKPELFVPLHGEYRNLMLHGRLAVESGVDPHNCHTLVDGDVLEVVEDGGRRAAPVEVGRVLVDGETVGNVDDSVLRDRRHIAEDGVILVILAVSHQTGRIANGPDLVSRGLPPEEATSQVFAEVKRKVVAKVNDMTPAAVADRVELREEVRLTVRRYFRRNFRRRPVVVPYIMEL
jgi:ribonuclease J